MKITYQPTHPFNTWWPGVMPFGIISHPIVFFQMHMLKFVISTSIKDDVHKIFESNFPKSAA